MGAPVPVSCPDCGAPVLPQRDQLCVHCGYPLMFLRQRAGAGDKQRTVAVAPGELDQPAPPAHPVLLQPYREPTGPGPGAAGPGELGCPVCRELNPAVRIRCQRCGHELRPARPGPVLLPPLPVPERSLAWLVWLAVGVLVLSATAVGVGYLVRRADRPRFTVPDPAASAGLTPVPAAEIGVSATHSDADTARYGVPNIIDGNPATAWHSGGNLIPTGNVGVELRFAFTRPVVLARITVVDGFARSPVDFRNNERIVAMTVRTDAGEKVWKLADTPDPQSLDLAPAPTSTVVFVIRETVPGTKFKDACVSEVTFDERR